MKNILLLFILFLSSAAIAQKDTLAKYSIAALIEKGQLDEANSKIYGDEVLNRNPSDSIKAQAFRIISEYYIYIVGDYAAAVTFCEKSLDFAKKANYTEYIMGGLTRQSINYAVLNKNEKVFPLLAELKEYRFEKNYELYNDEGLIYYLIGDFEKSRSLYFKRLEACIVAKNEKGITAEEYYNRSMIIEALYVCIGNLYNYEKKLDAASFYIAKAEKIENKYYNTTWHVKAFNLILRKDFDGALAYMDKTYEKAIKNFKIDNYQYLYYKAICYQQKGDYEKGLEFAKEAIKNKTPITSFQNFELECYKIAAECAEKLGKAEEASVYNKKYSEVSQKVNYASKAAFMAKLYEQNDVNPLKKELATKSSRAAMLFWGLGFASILAGYLIFRIAKSRLEKKKFLAIIERLESKNSLETQTATEETIFIEDIEEESSSKKNISTETETKILKKFENFEKKQRFLEPNISLGTLALDFKTNTTYITYVIKKHKNENLINYINKLRIEYIIQKMASDPEYANYKIEYLAQESGFASYSTFKRIFTKETGIDPSKFINYLKQAN